MICAGQPRIKYNKTLADYGIGGDEITPHRPPGPDYHLFSDDARKTGQVEPPFLLSPGGVVQLPKGAMTARIATALAMVAAGHRHLTRATPVPPIRGFGNTENGGAAGITAISDPNSEANSDANSEAISEANSDVGPAGMTPAILPDGTPLRLHFAQLEDVAEKTLTIMERERVTDIAAGRADDLIGATRFLPAKDGFPGGTLTVERTGLTLRLPGRPPLSVAFADNPLAAPIVQVLFDHAPGGPTLLGHRRTPSENAFNTGITRLFYNANLLVPRPPQEHRPGASDSRVLKERGAAAAGQVLSAMLPPGLFSGSWSIWSFVVHYFFGEGEPVELREIGLAERFENTESVREETEERMRLELAKRQPGRRVATGQDGVKYKLGAWRLDPFFVFDDGWLDLVTECDETGCNFTFILNDEFADPLGIGWEPGTRYPFRHEFRRRMAYEQ